MKNVRKEILIGIIPVILFGGMFLVLVLGYLAQRATPVDNSTLRTINTTSNGKTFTTADVSQHNRRNDCWLIIGGKVYDVTSFLSQHPGGSGLITPFCGQDATLPFKTMGGRGAHSQRAVEILSSLYIGDLGSGT